MNPYPTEHLTVDISSFIADHDIFVDSLSRNPPVLALRLQDQFRTVQKPTEDLKVDIKRVEKKPKATLALVQDDSTSDPESLYGSEKLHDIVART